jgi:hypothetical protein
VGEEGEPLVGEEEEEEAHLNCYGGYRFHHGGNVVKSDDHHLKSHDHCLCTSCPYDHDHRPSDNVVHHHIDPWNAPDQTVGDNLYHHPCGGSHDRDSVCGDHPDDLSGRCFDLKSHNPPYRIFLQKSSVYRKR